MSGRGNEVCIGIDVAQSFELESDIWCRHKATDMERLRTKKALKLASFNESKSICFRFNWVCCLKWENVTCAKAVKRRNSEKSSLDLTLKWKQFKCLSNTDRTIKAATAAALALVEVTERSDVLWNTFSTLGNHAHEQSLIEFEPRKPKSASITVDVDIQQF